MSRGRKSISSFNGSEWESVFYNSVGTYVQYINLQLSKEYKLEPLSNHLKIIGGYAFKTAEYKNQGIPIIRISDFNNEQIVLKDVVFYQESKELDRYQLVEGDIIIALTGGTIAKLAIVQSGLGKIYLNQRVGKFQALKPDEFEVEYIYWLARSIQSIIKNLAWGAAIPNVSPKQIEELKFPFPSKKTQRGIIDFLNDLKNNNLKEDKIYFDENIENEIILLQKKQLATSEISTELTHQLTLVKKLRQQLLQDAVQGKLVEQSRKLSGPKDEPASELLKKIKAERLNRVGFQPDPKKDIGLKPNRSSNQSSGLKPRAIKELPPIKPEEIPFEIPENWVWCRLNEICEAIIDCPHSTPHYIEYETGYYGIDTNCINEKGEITRLRSLSFESYLERIKRLVPKENDIVYAREGSIGLATLIPKDKNICLGQRVMLFRASKAINHLYLIYAVTDVGYKNRLLAKHRGMGAKHVNVKDIVESLIALPPLAEQERIVQKLDALMQYCNELEASIKESELQNSTLLQQVLREALSLPRNIRGKEPVGV